MYALIQSNVVSYLSTATFAVHSSLVWIQLTPTQVGQVNPGDTYKSATQSFSAPVLSILKQWIAVRQMAKELLEASDWTQVADEKSSMSTTDVQAWQSYRSSLRTIASSFTSPVDVVWPTAPTTERVR